jgi:protein ImuA
MNVSAESRQTLVASLRRKLDHFEAGQPVKDDQPISTGVVVLDGLLPAGGLKRGTLVEYLATSAGCGAGTLALSAAREACSAGRALVVVEQQVAGTLRVPSSAYGTRSVPATYFYPPAAAAWGVDLSRLLVLRPVNEADALWALDQALRCSGVGAVWARWDAFDGRDFRRLQLAAECGGTLGLLIRPARQRGQPTWADVRFEVRSVKYEVRNQKLNERSQKQKSKGLAVSSSFVLRPSFFDSWRIEVELVRCRGAAGSRVVLLELDESMGSWREVTDEATNSVPVPAPVADSTGAWGA